MHLKEKLWSYSIDFDDDSNFMLATQIAWTTGSASLLDKLLRKMMYEFTKDDLDNLYKVVTFNRMKSHIRWMYFAGYSY